MIKIEGLEKLERELKRAQDALAELDGELGSVSFEPGDPVSIERAISTMERMVDEKLAGFEGSDLISALSEQMKEQFRSAILDKAAEARLEDDE